MRKKEEKGFTCFERNKSVSRAEGDVVIEQRRKVEGIVCLDNTRLRPSVDGLRPGFTPSNEAPTNDVGFASKYTDLLVEGFTSNCMLSPLNLVRNAG